MQKKNLAEKGLKIRKGVTAEDIYKVGVFAAAIKWDTEMKLTKSLVGIVVNLHNLSAAFQNS